MYAMYNCSQAMHEYKVRLVECDLKQKRYVYVSQKEFYQCTHLTRPNHESIQGEMLA
jgi:hypothetical protein